MHDGRISDGLRYRPGAFFEQCRACTREAHSLGLMSETALVEINNPASSHRSRAVFYVKLLSYHFGANGGFAFRWPSSSASIFAISSASSLTFCESQLIC